MSTRKFEVVVYGATGFTGKLIATHMQRHGGLASWAIAGRSIDKLNRLRDELRLIHSSAPTGPNTQVPEVVVADINDAPQAFDFFRDATLVLNCTGPYRFLGHPVVRACLVHGTHYMDISGEPQFMESSYLQYNDMAVERGCTVIHACAFDSVPNDLGNLFVNRQYAPRCCSSIESFIEVQAAHGLKGHFATYESAVHGFGDAQARRHCRYIT